MEFDSIHFRINSVNITGLKIFVINNATHPLKINRLSIKFSILKLIQQKFIIYRIDIYGVKLGIIKDFQIPETIKPFLSINRQLKSKKSRFTLERLYIENTLLQIINNKNQLINLNLNGNIFSPLENSSHFTGKLASEKTKIQFEGKYNIEKKQFRIKIDINTSISQFLSNLNAMIKGQLIIERKSNKKFIIIPELRIYNTKIYFKNKLKYFDMSSYPLILNGKLTYSNRLIVESLKLNYNKEYIKISGPISDDNIKLMLNADMGMISEMLNNTIFKDFIPKLSGEIKYTGKIKLDNNIYLNGKLDLINAKLMLGFLQGMINNISFSANIKNNNTDFTIRDINFNNSIYQIEANTVYKPKKKERILAYAILKGEKFDIAWIDNTFVSPIIETSKKISLHNLPHKLQGRIILDELNISKFRFRNLNTEYLLSSTKFQAKNIQCFFLDTPISGSFIINIDKDITVVDIVFEKLSVKKIIDYFFNPKELKIYGNSTATIHILSTDYFSSSMDGRGSIKITNGSILGSAPQLFLYKKLPALKFKLERYMFSILKSNLLFDLSNIYIKSFEIISDEISISGNGNFNYKKNKINMEVILKIKKSFFKDTSSPVSSLLFSHSIDNNYIIGLSITGDISNVKVKEFDTTKK